MRTDCSDELTKSVVVFIRNMTLQINGEEHGSLHLPFLPRKMMTMLRKIPGSPAKLRWYCCRTRLLVSPYLFPKHASRVTYAENRWIWSLVDGFMMKRPPALQEPVDKGQHCEVSMVVPVQVSAVQS